MLFAAFYTVWARLLDFFTDYFLVYRIYVNSRKPENLQNTDFLLALGVSFICAIANYLIGYSALLSIELSAGSYEEDKLQKHSCFLRLFKLGFLSFVGPLYLVLFELIQLIKSIFMILGLIGGPSCS